MEDETHFCRLCLSASVVYYSLLRNNGKEMLYSLTGIKITENDPYSTESCAKCWLDLKYSYFIQQCFIETDKKLQESGILIIPKAEPMEVNSEVKLVEGKHVKQETINLQIKEEYQYEEMEECEKLEDSQSIEAKYSGPDNIAYYKFQNNDNIKEDVFQNIDIMSKSSEDCKDDNKFGITNDSDKGSENDEELFELIVIQTEEDAVKGNLGKLPSCFICGKEFQEDLELYSHINTHYNAPQHCEECSEKLPNIAAFRNHLHLKHPELLEKTYICDKCSVSFKYTSLYKLHVEVAHPGKVKKKGRPRKVVEHEDDVSLNCVKCDKTFKNRRSRDLHFANHTKKICPICGAKISSPNLNKHLAGHDTEPSVCDICGVTCKHRESLRWHKYYKHSGKRIVCKECGQVFNRPYPYKVHLQKHAGEKTFICDTCGKSFFTQYRLNLHIKTTHLKERRYVCQYCKQAFSKREAMRIHERKHTKEEPYVCEYCGEGFRQNISLRAHKRSKHNIIEEKKAQCPICHKMFKDNWALQSHTRSLHD